MKAKEPARATLIEGGRARSAPPRTIGDGDTGDLALPDTGGARGDDPTDLGHVAGFGDYQLRALLGRPPYDKMIAGGMKRRGEQPKRPTTKKGKTKTPPPQPSKTEEPKS